MRALTVRPPWGKAIAYWGKAVENRNSLVPTRAMLGERFAIHQGKWHKESPGVCAELAEREDVQFNVGQLATHYAWGVVATARLVGYIDERELGERTDEQMARDADLGTLTLTKDDGRSSLLVGRLDEWHSADAARSAALEYRRSPWWLGPIGWLLADVRPLRSPFDCPGRQGIWNLDDEQLASVQARM